MTQTTKTPWTDAHLDALASHVPVDRRAGSDAASDFGHLAHATPRAVAHPRDAAQVAKTIAFAHERGLRLATRAKRMSQGGQSLTRELALDVSALASVDAPDVRTHTISCDVGATWRSVVERCAPHGLLPRVLPLNLDLTVGGTLSVGGVGSTSHRDGPAIANVAALEAVDGTGTVHAARTGDDRALFDVALGGLGRAVTMTRAVLDLRVTLPRVRTFYLLYDDPSAWLADQRRLRSRCDSLEAFCTASIQGLRNTPHGRRPFARWFYGLHVSYEYQSEPPSETAALATLSHAWHTHTEDTETLAFTQRYEPRFAFMRRADTWSAPHPWVEAFLPIDALASLLPQLLDAVPLFLGDGHRVMMLATERLPRYFMTPPGEVAAFAILPVGVPRALVPDALAALAGVNDLLVKAGGKRYLSGWLGPRGCDESFERAHFGDRYDALVALRRRFDPHGTFSPASLADFETEVAS